MNGTRTGSGARGLKRYLITAVLIRLADEGARVALLLLALELQRRRARSSQLRRRLHRRGSLLWTWRPAEPARTPLTAMIALIATGVPLAIAPAVTPQVGEL